jgi:putative copper export protein
MAVDVSAIVLLALSFVATLQAAGLALFVAVFGHRLQASVVAIRRAGFWSALAGFALVVIQQVLEPARLTGELDDVWDAPLQAQALHSFTGIASLTRMAALAVIATSLVGSKRSWRLIGAIGAGVLSFAFLLTGHTSVNPSRGLLAPLLWTHLTIIAFWFGSLPALWITSRQETPALAAQLVAAFSAVAIRLVPCIALAGVAMACILLPNLAALAQPYGSLLLVKVGGFLMLMTLAAFNKWRLGPALASRGPQSVATFGHSLAAEYAIIVGVLTVTAVLTSTYSPEP